jgi:putative nucleotidyltransferase with HDIG domain
LDKTIESLLSADYAVPSLPSLYFNILRAMDSPDASIADVGAAISQDPGIVAKVLQLVNSAYFGLARRISSPVEALQLLGLQKVRSLVLSVHVFSCFDQTRMKNFPLSRLWNHSIAASHIAQTICRAEKADKITTEEAQLACMLHDVGKVVLASGDPDRYQGAVALALKNGVPLIEAETEVFGASHAEIGGFLLSRWGMPIAVIEAIALHHEPCRTAMECFSPLTVAHVATCLETELSDPVLVTTPTVIDMEYLARIGLADRLPLWREAVNEVELVAG